MQHLINGIVIITILFWLSCSSENNSENYFQNHNHKQPINEKHLGNYNLVSNLFYSTIELKKNEYFETDYIGCYINYSQGNYTVENDTLLKLFNFTPLPSLESNIDTLSRVFSIKNDTLIKINLAQDFKNIYVKSEE